MKLKDQMSKITEENVEEAIIGAVSSYYKKGMCADELGISEIFKPSEMKIAGSVPRSACLCKTEMGGWKAWQKIINALDARRRLTMLSK
jgi:hypothetical protein